MGFVNKYPYVDFHELNADALIAKVDDASAEAKAAAETVATYNDRLTTVESDLAPIKAAMPGIASDVNGLKHDVGIMDSLITNTINPGLDKLKNEVETPSTGLLDRTTALEGKVDEHDDDINNIEGRMTTYDQNFIDINNQFISDQGRIRDLETYRTEAQTKIGNLGYSIAPLFDKTAGYNAGDYVMSPTLKLHRARVNIPAGTADITNLTQFWPTDMQNALKGVRHNFTQHETHLTVDKAEYIEFDEYYIINIRFTATDNIAAHSVLFNSNISIDYATDYPGVVAASGQYNVAPFLVGTAGGLVTRTALTNGTFASISAVVFK